MKKILLTLLLLFIVTLAGCTELKRVKVLLPHSLVAMKKVSSHLYVEKSMSIKNQKIIEESIPKAKEYIADIYGDVTSQPVIYACQSEDCAKSFGLEGILAIRLLGHLILTNKALSKELISHEWSHEELYERIGGFWHWYKEMPLWFDEGLASLSMKKYSRYDETAWKRIVDKKIPYPKKEELVSLSQWGKANHTYLNNDEIVVPYVTARKIVTEWHKKVGQKGLVELLDGIKNGEKFEVLYEKEK